MKAMKVGDHDSFVWTKWFMMVYDNDTYWLLVWNIFFFNNQPAYNIL